MQKYAKIILFMALIKCFNGSSITKVKLNNFTAERSALKVMENSRYPYKM